MIERNNSQSCTDEGKVLTDVVQDGHICDEVVLRGVPPSQPVNLSEIRTLRIPPFYLLQSPLHSKNC